MKKLLLITASALLGASSAQAQYFQPLTFQTYSLEATITPGASAGSGFAAGSGLRVFSFQNTSATLDVVVQKIEVISVTSGTVTGGLMQFYVFGSTQITAQGTTLVTNVSLTTPLTAGPATVIASTAPISILLDGAAPLIRPLLINDDEAATANFSDAYSALDGNSAPLLLPHNTSRALVIEKRQFGATDFSAGQVLIRILYYVK